MCGSLFEVQHFDVMHNIFLFFLFLFYGEWKLELWYITVTYLLYLSAIH